MTDDEGFSNGVANEAKEQLLRTNQRYNRLLFTLVSLACVVGLVLVFIVAVGIVRLQDYARVNRRLGEQNSRLLKAQEQSDQFGKKAVECVLANFAEHRYTNQAVHDAIARALGIPPTPHTPLPQRYTEQEFMDVCAPFGAHP